MNICGSGQYSAAIFLDDLSSHSTVLCNIIEGGDGHGIQVHHSNYNLVSSNYVIKCAYHGIYLSQSAGSQADHNEIIGNFCIANSQDTDNAYDDILIRGSYNNIQGNFCRAGSETNKPAYAIEIYDSNCVSNKVINNDNYDDGFSTWAYLDDGTTTIYLEPEDTRDFLKYFGDRTLFSGGAITAHGDADGSVAIASCTAWSKETDSDTADGVFFSYVGKAKQTLTDLSVNLIYLDYNAGTPQIVVATTPITYGFQQDHILLGVVFRQGTAVHIFQSSNVGIQGINRTFMHAVEHLGAHRTSGLVTTDGGSLALSITAGIIYAGLNRQATTVNGTTWSYWYTTDSGATWTEDTSQSVLVQSYNDITSGKVALGSNKYGVHWVYVDYEGTQLHIVYGQGNYTANQAEEAGVPSVLPPIVTGYGILIAKIINQEGTNTLTITYPWTTVFTSSLATDHGSLAGLADDDHTQYIKHSLATAISDFLVASGAGVFIKKTLAEVKTLLNIANDIATHASDNSAHHPVHIKTLVDHPLSIIPTMDDAHIPAAIARDAEVATAVSDHAALTTGIHGAGVNTLWHGGLTNIIDKTHLSQDFGPSSARLLNIILTTVSGILLQIDNTRTGPFTALINGAPTATSVIYDGDANESLFNGLASGATVWGRIILHNTTRGNSRKVVSVNLATNTITTESSTDDWADGDNLTTQSQTNAAVGMFDVDISTSVPSTWAAILINGKFLDNSGAGGGNSRDAWWHPYEAIDYDKLAVVGAYAANSGQVSQFWVPIVSQKICMHFRNSTDVHLWSVVAGHAEYADT